MSRSELSSGKFIALDEALVSVELNTTEDRGGRPLGDNVIARELQALRCVVLRGGSVRYIVVDTGVERTDSDGSVHELGLDSDGHRVAYAIAHLETRNSKTAHP